MKTLFIVAVALLFGSCHRHGGPRPAPMDAVTPLATVAMSPYDVVSPWLCRITATDLTCVATVDIRFRRGQLETKYARGSAFSFTNPQGNGNGQVFFGCAGKNQCGPGFFMFASKSVKITPTQPARFWDGGSETLVPYGSLGIVEVTVENNTFTSIGNRWTGSTAPPLLAEGNGIAVQCNDQACTISVK